MSDFHLRIISRTKIEYDADVESLVAPGEDGYLGVLADHMALVTTLGPGRLSLREPGERTLRPRYAITEGFLEVHHNHVSILVPSVQEIGAAQAA